MPRALITGITGQDGSYLAEGLLARGYTVYGLVRRHATPTVGHLAAVQDRIHWIAGDVTDPFSWTAALAEAEPDEIYHLAAQSYVGVSWTVAASTYATNVLGTVYGLEAMRRVAPRARWYQASSSEMFGQVRTTPQTETTPFAPRSPYGVSKAAAHWAAVNARESYGLFVCCGILFNHESPRRGPEFVTRRITQAVARIAAGDRTPLTLGTLTAQRDWGYAPEYVEAMWRMLQQDTPGDYVIATGTAHTVAEWAAAAFAAADLDWREWVQVDPARERPAEVALLCGDATRAARQLGWQPTVRFEDLVRLMVEADQAAWASRDRSAQPPTPLPDR